MDKNCRCRKKAQPFCCQLVNLFQYGTQAYYKHLKTEATEQLQQAIVVKLVGELRLKMPRIGGKKLYYLLKPQLGKHDIDIGRDKFFDVLGAYNLLVRRRKSRKPLTTDSGHPFFKYPNLIRDMEVVRPRQLWGSDITYIPVGTGFCYLSLITDAYSRKIVGSVSISPKVSNCVRRFWVYSCNEPTGSHR